MTRIEKENESNQVELSNPTLHDIIATNHVMLTRKPREERLSRACKAVIIMIILGLVAIGIIILTLLLARSRNSLMAMIARSAETNLLPTSNNSQLENLTTITNEHTDNENWQKPTVSLTGSNFHMLTTENIHISSSIMRTIQQNEHISSDTYSMKPNPSSNTIINDQSTMPTTVSNQQTTTFASSSYYSTILMTTMKSQEYVQTSSNSLMTSVVDSTLALNGVRENTTSMPEETSFTTFINRHFDIQTSTNTNDNKKNKNKLIKKLQNYLADADVIDDILFS